MDKAQTVIGKRIPPVIAAVALITSLYEWAVFVSTFKHPGAIGINYNAPGTDWMVFYEAIRAVLDGSIGEIFDGNHFTSLINLHQHDWLSNPLPFRPWVYPPSFLLVLIPFGLTTFPLSYAAFQFLSALGLAWAATRCRAMSRTDVALILLSPAAAICVTSGQTAFLIAALLIGGLHLADRKPLWSGVLLSILTFKPQFFLLVPVALIAGRNWRALSATALFAFIFSSSSAVLFGVGPWIWWIKQSFQSLMGTDPRWVEYGRLWGNSIYACAIALGSPVRIASTLQLAAVLAGIIAVYATYRSSLDAKIKLAIFLAVAFGVAPHSGPYDGVLLIVAAWFWLLQYKIPSGSITPWVPTLILWMMPLFSPPILTRIGALMPLVILFFICQMWLTCRVPRTS